MALEPLMHTDAGLEGTPPCPACVLAHEIAVEMGVSLERASRSLYTDDIAVILALLVSSVADAAPTEIVRCSFLEAFTRNVMAFMEGDTCSLGSSNAPTKGEIN